MSKPFNPPSLDARIEMIDGYFDLPKVNIDAMNAVRAVLKKAALEIKAIAATVPNADMGTLVRSVQLLQECKDVTCQAFIINEYKPK